MNRLEAEKVKPTEEIEKIEEKKQRSISPRMVLWKLLFYVGSQKFQICFVMCR